MDGVGNPFADLPVFMVARHQGIPMVCQPVRGPTQLSSETPSWETTVVADGMRKRGAGRQPCVRNAPTIVSGESDAPLGYSEMLVSETMRCLRYAGQMIAFPRPHHELRFSVLGEGDRLLRTRSGHQPYGWIPDRKPSRIPLAGESADETYAPVDYAQCMRLRGPSSSIIGNRYIRNQSLDPDKFINLVQP